MPTVKLFGGLRRLVSNATMTVPGATVRSVLQSLCADHADLHVAIWDHDKIRQHVRVMVDGRDVELGLGLETPVTPNDEIAVFPPIAGGTRTSGGTK